MDDVVTPFLTYLAALVLLYVMGAGLFLMILRGGGPRAEEQFEIEATRPVTRN